jgi:hypothetical protein
MLKWILYYLLGVLHNELITRVSNFKICLTQRARWFVLRSHRAKFPTLPKNKVEIPSPGSQIVLEVVHDARDKLFIILRDQITIYGHVPKNKFKNKEYINA